MAENENKPKETINNDNKPKENEGTNPKEKEVDVEGIKSAAKAEYLKSLGLDEDTLKSILKKHKEDEDKNKSELEKKDDIIKQTTLELKEAKEARLISDAKLAAVNMGAKPELIEDLVIVAKSKVTEEKDILAVISEMKESTSGKVYFKSEEEEKSDDKEKDKKKNKGTYTRTRVDDKGKEKDKEEKEGEGEGSEHEGTIAQRLLSKRKKKEAYYFK